MNKLVIIYSDKNGGDDVCDWGRLITLNDIEGRYGRLIAISCEGSNISVERHDDVDDIQIDPQMIYIQEFEGDFNDDEAEAYHRQIIQCVEKYTIESKEIYVVIHDNVSRHHDSVSFSPDTIYGTIIAGFKEWGIDTEDISILPFWHDSVDSKFPKIWPFIKGCLDALDPIIHVDAYADGYEKLVDYLSDCSNRGGGTQGELRSLLLPLAIYDLFMQADIKNQELQDRIIESATISKRTLGTCFPEILNSNPLDLDNYTDAFHRSLKNISSQLLK